jgi:hypothetical protein
MHRQRLHRAGGGERRTRDWRERAVILNAEAAEAREVGLREIDEAAG